MEAPPPHDDALLAADGSCAGVEDAAEERESERFPWPPAEHESIAAAAIETWRGAAMHPKAFFSAMPRRGPLGPALLYYLPLGVLCAGIDLFWRYVLGPFTPPSSGALARLAAQAQPIRPLVDFLLSPVYLLAALFVGAAIVHVSLVIVGAARHGFRTTARVSCFAYSPAVLAVIPRIGWLFASIWMVVLMIIGLREAHETSGMRAAAAVLLPLLLLTFLMVLVVMMALAGLFLLPVL